MKPVSSVFCCRSALALLLAGAAFPTSAGHAPDVLEQFDREAALSSPIDPTDAAVTSETQGPVPMGARAGQPEFTVRQRLRSTVQFSDGDEAALFDGDYNGTPATFVRDHDALTVAVRDVGGIRLTAFRAGADQPIETFLRTMTRPTGNDWVPGSPVGATVNAAMVGDGPPPTDPTIVVFLHDELIAGQDPLTVERSLLASRFAWWVKRMEFDIMNDPHSTSWKPVERKVKLLFRSGIPGITRLPYGYTGVVGAWREVVQNWREPGVTDVPGGLAARWSLLLTRNMPSPGAVGIAEQTYRSERTGQIVPGRYGLASVDENAGVDVAAHEIGHMMGGRHELAETRVVGWFGTCETIMYHSDGANKCLTYSLPNTELIRSELGRVLPGR